MLREPQASPPRILRFRAEEKSLDLQLQRSQSWMVIRGQYGRGNDRATTENVVLRSKERDILAITSLASDGSFVIETRWAKKSTIYLEVGDFFVPVIRALDRPKASSATPSRRRSDRWFSLAPL